MTKIVQALVCLGPGAEMFFFFLEDQFQTLE